MGKINNIGKLMLQIYKEKSDEDRRREWKEKAQIRVTHWEDIFNKTKSEGTQREILALMSCELETGICPNCRHKWREVEFENRFGYVHYFEPACQCYPRCPHCHKWLYQELVSGELYVFGSNTDWRCSNCRWWLILNGKKRYGLDYELEQYETDNRQMWYEKLHPKQAARKEEDF